MNDLERAVHDARQQVALSRGSAQDDTGLPWIQVYGRPLRDLTADAFQALEAANDPPILFVRGGALTRVRRDEQQRPLLETLTEDHLRGILTRTANFVYEQGEQIIHVSPPRDLVRDLLTFGTYPMFPPLEGVVSSPIFRPDVTIVTQAGYDRTTRLLYLPPPEFVLPPIPDAPTPAEAQAAAQYLLQELCGDFPFALDSPGGHGSASQTHMLAVLLSCVLRPVIDGPIPLALISAPQRGSGKTLLAELVVLLTTGQDASVMAAPYGDEEWRKRISSVLASGTPVAILDNVVTTLASPSLAAMLTAHTWQDRLLGRNDQVLVLPARTIWIVTATNPTIDTDLARRSLSIHLDAKTPRPWQGRTFRHADIRAWTKAHRGELLAALCTIGLAWFAAGQPPASTPRLGKFEAWSDIIGGALALAQTPHFLGNLQALYDHMDPEAQQWEAFLAALGHHFGHRSFTVSQVVERLREAKDSRLREVLPDHLADALDGGEGNFRKRLGRAFRQHTEVRYGDAGIFLTRAEKDTQKNVNRWRVVGYQGATGEHDFHALWRRLKGGQDTVTTRDAAVPSDAAPETCQAPVEDPRQESPTASPTAGDEAGEEHRTARDPVELPLNRDEWPPAWQDAWEERAAILQVDGNQSRTEAERLAEETIRHEYRQRHGPLDHA